MLEHITKKCSVSFCLIQRRAMFEVLVLLSMRKSPNVWLYSLK